jgi:hypothetical protein
MRARMSGEYLAHHDKEYRHQKHRQQGRGDHAAHHTRAYSMATLRTCPGGNRQGQHTHNKSDGGHQDRTEAQTTGFQGRVYQAHAVVLQLARKFDDQNRVLGRQTDNRDQPHFEIHIVGQAA